MTDEAFWIRLETDALPHVNPKFRRDFETRISFLKNPSRVLPSEFTQHEWLTMACLLRNLYWEGHQVKTLIEHCAVKGGSDPTKIAL